MDIVFQYPPELLALLIDAIPKLCKSKVNLLDFFKGAGVEDKILRPFRDLLRQDKNAFNKYHVTRDVLSKLNERGEGGLRERREVLKRVSEFQEFSVCWQQDQASARGLVAQIRELVNVKDSFTRINIERERERKERLAVQESKAVAAKLRDSKIDEVKSQLFALFGEPNAHKRGKELEAVLNALFEAYGILVKDAFTVKGYCGEGVIEQIDGLIEIDGFLYLVELKWWNSPLGTAEVSPHLVRVYNRGGNARGIFISYSDFTAPAITTCREALGGGVVIVLAQLQEIVEILTQRRDLRNWLKSKITAAISERNPLYFPIQD